MAFLDPEALPNDTLWRWWWCVLPKNLPHEAVTLKTREGRSFNYRLSNASQVVVNTFGTLANRSQILLTTKQHGPEKANGIVEACCILHNFMRTRYPVLQNRLVDRQQGNGEMEPGEWKQGCNQMDSVVVQCPNRASCEGKKQCNLWRHWCNSPARSVEWQDRMIDDKNGCFLEYHA